MFLIRIWQGKVILLCLMVPVLLVYALRYVERPTRDRAGWLFAGGVARWGCAPRRCSWFRCSPSAVRPPCSCAALRQALLGFVAMAAYPLAPVAVTIAVHGRSADLFGTRALYRFSPSWFGHEIFLTVRSRWSQCRRFSSGPCCVPHPAGTSDHRRLRIDHRGDVRPARHPPVVRPGGPGPDAVAGVVDLHRRGSGRILGAWVSSTDDPAELRWAPIRPRGGLCAVFGMPIWSGGNGVGLELPPHWQRGSQSVDSAQRAIAAIRPGDVVLAPEELAVTIAVITTRVKTVAPRDYYMDYLKDDPSFHYEARRGWSTSQTSSSAEWRHRRWPGR